MGILLHQIVLILVGVEPSGTLLSGTSEKGVSSPCTRLERCFTRGRNPRLVGSLNLPLVFGRSVIVTDRYIHIWVPRRIQTWTVHWTGNRIRHSSRVRRLTIDTDRQRRVVGDGIFAPRGRVIYEAGPRIDYPAIVRLHLRGCIRGERDYSGNLVVAESVDSHTSETTVV